MVGPLVAAPVVSPATAMAIKVSATILAMVYAFIYRQTIVVRVLDISDKGARFCGRIFNYLRSRSRRTGNLEPVVVSVANTQSNYAGEKEKSGDSIEEQPNKQSDSSITQSRSDRETLAASRNVEMEKSDYSTGISTPTDLSAYDDRTTAPNDKTDGTSADSTSVLEFGTQSEVNLSSVITYSDISSLRSGYESDEGKYIDSPLSDEDDCAGESVNVWAQGSFNGGIDDSVHYHRMNYGNRSDNSNSDSYDSPDTLY